MRQLHLDLETYSSVDITESGVYKYVESVDFEILIIAYSLDDGEIKIVDLASGELMPEDLIAALTDPEMIKKAFNAAFERLCFRAVGIESPILQWRCTEVKAAYCGLPGQLGKAGKILGFGIDKAKDSAGKALIKFFSCPVKPTKANGWSYRNLPVNYPEKWEAYKNYCVQDVQAEKAVDLELEAFVMPEREWEFYALDQSINDRGILLDTDLAESACKIDSDNMKVLLNKLKKITEVDNPNSPTQLKKWLSDALGKDIKSIAADTVKDILEITKDEAVREVLHLRQKTSKSSIKKYKAILNCVSEDGRGHGFFRFYGASRTGRWAGRLVQLQNLARNYMSDLGTARETTKLRDFELMEVVYGGVSNILSQLIRTALISPENHTFAVADFSAIEARVLAWLASESWKEEVFASHGLIYEANAANMFGVDISEVDKPLRQKGKIAELALGYQGGVGALVQMGAENMGLSHTEMSDIVKRWRAASPKTVKLWKSLEESAKDSILSNKKIKTKYKGVCFEMIEGSLAITLPSGRQLVYRDAKVVDKKIRLKNGEVWDTQGITYYGLSDHKWSKLDTYGGKLTENIVQAIARDILAESMCRVDAHGWRIVMHVHDEIICETKKIGAEKALHEMCETMGEEISWAKGLKLGAEGYLTTFYKKD